MRRRYCSSRRADRHHDVRDGSRDGANRSEPESKADGGGADPGPERTRGGESAPRRIPHPGKGVGRGRSVGPLDRHSGSCSSAADRRTLVHNPSLHPDYYRGSGATYGRTAERSRDARRKHDRREQIAPSSLATRSASASRFRTRRGVERREAVYSPRPSCAGASLAAALSARRLVFAARVWSRRRAGRRAARREPSAIPRARHCVQNASAAVAGARPSRSADASDARRLTCCGLARRTLAIRTHRRTRAERLEIDRIVAHESPLTYLSMPACAWVRCICWVRLTPSRSVKARGFGSTETKRGCWRT